jgi:hypothetical protein
MPPRFGGMPGSASGSGTSTTIDSGSSCAAAPHGNIIESHQYDPANHASARRADKVVYSTTANPRLERRFDPSAVRDLKAAASWDLLVGGPNLAAQALVAGLID